MANGSGSRCETIILAERSKRTTFLAKYWIPLSALLFALATVDIKNKYYLSAVLTIVSGIGLAMNGFVVEKNQGFMPVIDLKNRIKKVKLSKGRCWAGPYNTHLWLGDRYWLGIGFFSLGDLLILGALVLNIARKLW